MMAIPISLVYFNRMLEILQTSKPLKNAFKGIATQVGWGASGTIIGGIVGGAAGAFVGGIVGSFIGYSAVDEYDSLIKVLREMSEEEKYRLQKKIQELIGSNLIEDLLAYVQSEVNRGLLLNVISSHAKGG